MNVFGVDLGPFLQVIERVVLGWTGTYAINGL